MNECSKKHYIMIKKVILIFTLLTLLSPTLIVNAQTGCCSWHGGVDYCDESIGKIICRDGTESPSCTCNYTPPEQDNNNKINLEEYNKANITLTPIEDSLEVEYNKLKEEKKKIEEKYKQLKKQTEKNEGLNLGVTFVFYILTLLLFLIFQPKQFNIKSKTIKTIINIVNFLLTITCSVVVIPLCLGINGYFGLEIISILTIIFIHSLSTD